MPDGPDVRNRAMSAAATGGPAVAKAMERTHTLYLKADWTRRDDAITRALQHHGRSGVPLYLLYAPGQPEPRILPQLLTEGLVVEALERKKWTSGRQADAP